ncbi:MAG TPA: energy-coupling factor ABC transporter ATP-binding protein [Firmicutes bacterium]|jgi:energy-coupling factor transport system ATP-binding protein|nr:energy-coupling factor ABC transporter ATP-binding protein [Bacillota bacterium]
MDPVITVEHLTFRYPTIASASTEAAALKDVSFSIHAGEFVGITGPAGAGKSTLVLTINGIIPHFQSGIFQGKVLINGRDTFETSCSEISRQVGSVFQDPEAQLVTPTVEDEIAFGLENFGFEPGLIESRIQEALHLIGITNLRNRSTSELSGGQKQRVSIAAAVALRPGILILDEPTSELDPMGTMEVFEVLKQLNQQFGLTIIVVEQKINILMEYIQRLLVLNQGSLVFDRTPREIIKEPETLHSVGLRVPPVSELAYLLKKAALYTEELPLTVDEAYSGLQKSLGRRKEEK